MPSSNRKEEEEGVPTKRRRRIKKDGYGASLPYEMIIEVLQWLPVKSALRFRAVCRSWAALLSSDEFRSLHMAARRAPPKLLYISPTAGYDSTEVYSCPLSPSSSGNLLFTIDGARGNCVEVVSPAPCRGLILLYDALATAYYICNAATRAVTRLPPSTNKASRSTTGLGFDARTKEYKVVRLIIGMPGDEDGVRCELYTPGGRYGDCWRPVAGGVPSSLRHFVNRKSRCYECISEQVTTCVRKRFPALVDGSYDTRSCYRFLFDHRGSLRVHPVTTLLGTRSIPGLQPLVIRGAPSGDG